MTQILDPIPSYDKNEILCCYVNATSQIQVARITNIPNWYFERVVFPGQRLVFETVPQASLEIHSGMMASSILSDVIPCYELRIDQEQDPVDPGLKKTELNPETKYNNISSLEGMTNRYLQPV